MKNFLFQMRGTDVKSIPLLLVMSLLLTACMGSGGSGSPAGVPINLYKNTEFDGENLRLFVNLKDGTETSVNTTDHVFDVQPGMTPVPGHQARAWTFLKITDDATSVAHALVSWYPDDPADYLMAGWWAEFPGQKPLLSFEDPRLELFALIDGSALDMASRRSFRSTGQPLMRALPGGSTHTSSAAAGERMRAAS